VKSYSIQFFYNIGLSSAAIFTPVFAQQLGASDFTIGLIGMLYGTSIFISGMYFGRQADVKGRRRYMMVGLLLAAFLAPVQALATTPEQLAMSRFALGFAAGMFPPALMAYAHDQGKRMGTFAAVGSLGFGIGNLLVSFVAAATWLYGTLQLASRVYFTGALALAAAFAMAMLLKPVPRAELPGPAIPLDVIKRNRDVYFSFLIRHTGANAVWVIFPLYILALSPRASDGGPDYTWLGIIYAANTLSQVPIMLFINPFNGRRLVVAGEVLTLFTFIGFYFSQNHLHLLLFSIPLAASWSCLYVGSLKTVMERSPEKATATGLLTSTTSLSAIFGPLIGGAVAQAFGGYRATILVAAAMTVAALVAFKVLTDAVERKYESGRPPQAH
jgi:MFS family permease